MARKSNKNKIKQNTLCNEPQEESLIREAFLEMLSSLSEQELELLVKLAIQQIVLKRKKDPDPSDQKPPSPISNPSETLPPKRKKYTIRIEYRKCGKKCKCNGGKGHGPYRYMYWWENGRLRSKYLGKA